jgi:hypothetical protein
MENISKEEIWEILHSIQKEKSLGLDGWLVEYFIGFYEVLEQDLLRVVEESRASGKILVAYNTTFIALIPKSNSPVGFEEYMSISLCNCIYKIISKIIATRMKELLCKTISYEQFGFLVMRQIHEVIIVAQEVFHTIKTKKQLAMVIKVDLSKAYDRVN